MLPGVQPRLDDDGEPLPALNEEASIDWVLEHIPSWVVQVVLVDGLSTDLTEIVARSMRPDIVIVHQRTPGKGAALWAGFAAAYGEIVVMLDADGSTESSSMWEPVHAQESHVRPGDAAFSGLGWIPSLGGGGRPAGGFCYAAPNVWFVPGRAYQHKRTTVGALASRFRRFCGIAGI